MIDISGISYFIPLLTFLVVFLIVYAVAKASKFLPSEGANLFAAFVVASAAGPRAYVTSIVPWFAVLLISFFLLMALLKFASVGDWDKGIAKAFAVILIIAFVISGIFVFSSYFHSYLPWNSASGANPDVLRVTDWLFSSRVLGAILLLIVTAIISFLVVKGVPGKK
jgi:hypothetical protein